MKLTGRDQAIVKFLFENKISSFAQLKARFFNHASDKALYRRLSKLRKANLVTKSIIFDCTGKQVSTFSATKTGIKALLELSNTDLLGVKLKSDSANHDVKLVDIRLDIETREKVHDYKTENQILLDSSNGDSKFDLFKELGTDAAVKIELQKDWIEWIPIEFELTRKTLERSKEKLQRYLLEKSIPALILIVKDQSLREMFQKLETELVDQTKSKILYSVYSDTVKNEDQCIFHLSNGKQIDLGRHTLVGS